MAYQDCANLPWVDTEHGGTPVKDSEGEAAALPPAQRDWPLPWQSSFLGTLQLMPDVSAACRIAGIGRTTAYRTRTGSADFAEAWDEAIALAHDLVQRRAHEWIMGGVPVKTTRTRRKIKNGVVVEEETTETVSAERSATLMIFWLKAWNPERYRWAERVEATGPDGGAIQVESLDKIDRDIAALTAELEQRARGSEVPVEE